MITLYYIEYLNRVNEPLFESEDKQASYFSTKKVVSIDSGFYAPYFTNEIILTNDDIDFATKCNYVSFEYANKTYYYYIDTIEYVSEDTIKLHVTMDTIQTYMFNITNFNIKVVRQTIERWSKDENDKYIINRNYNRENVSQAEMEVVRYKKQHDKIYWLVVWLHSNSTFYYKAADDTMQLLPVNESAYGFKSGVERNTNVVAHAMPICLPIYVGDDEITDVILGIGGSHAAVSCNQYLCIPGIVSSPDVIKVDYYMCNILNATVNVANSKCYIEFPRLSGLYGNTTRYLYYKLNDSYQSVGMVYIPADFNEAHKMNTTFNDIDNPHVYLNTYLDQNFARNTAKSKNFSTKYIPALIDENYIQLEYGEYLGSTTYPLSKLLSNELFHIKVYDFVSNTRTYYLSANSDTSKLLTDPYANIIINNTAETVELYNDAWKEWYSRNQATWTQGYTLAQNKNWYRYITDTISNLGSLGQLGGARSMGSLIGGAVSAGLSQVNTSGEYFIRDYTIEQERAIQKGNLEGTPDTLKQGNNWSNDAILGNLDEIEKIKVVRDLDSVGKYFERNGYSVNIYYDKCSLQDKRIHLRTYYDYICGNIYDLVINCLLSVDIIDDIKYRFATGLRLWHEDTTFTDKYNIGDYTYDNVETAYL